MGVGAHHDPSQGPSSCPRLVIVLLDVWETFVDPAWLITHAGDARAVGVAQGGHTRSLELLVFNDSLSKIPSLIVGFEINF